MKTLKTISIALLALTFASCCEKPTDERPNILFVLCDDLGYSDVGFMQTEDCNIKDIVTPNMDKLAAEGTKFTSAYSVHPFCGPSRAGMMTGRYPHEFGSQFNLAFFVDHGVDQSETYFPELLQDTGYYTGIVGKWHLGETKGYRPTERGFDEFYGWLGGGHLFWTSELFSVDKSAETMLVYPKDSTKNGSYDSYKLAMVRDTAFVPAPEQNEYMTEHLTKEGIAFIDRAKAKKQPFFLFLSLNAPHTPLVAKKEDIKELESEPYNIQFRTKQRGIYSAMIYNVDKQMQLLVDALKERDMYENTLIVFMSDNGGKGPNPIEGRKNSPLRGEKGDVYEGGNRVPMFMHWPAGLKDAPRVYEHVVSGLDLFPTFVGLAQGTIPEGEIIRGKNIIPNVIANTDAREGNPYFALRVNSPYNRVSIRKGDWKAVTVKSGEWMLYNIKEDMAENNPVTTEPEILAELMKAGAEWVKTHKEPAWFDSYVTYNFEHEWNKAGMPAFDRTFPGYTFEVEE